MSIQHHPSEETLIDFTAGTLDEGRSLVVATHLASCSSCRRAMKQLEAIGGMLLDTMQSSALSPRSRTMTIFRTGGVELSDAGRNIHAASASNGHLSPLSLFEAGEWRWIGPGIHSKSVAVETNGAMRVFMLRAAAGTRLPDHRHAGTEWTCVLEGAYRHDLGYFGPGDFDEADESVEHRPQVVSDGECICLVALSGKIELQGWAGRLIAPVVQL